MCVRLCACMQRGAESGGEWVYRASGGRQCACMAGYEELAQLRTGSQGVCESGPGRLLFVGVVRDPDTDARI